MNGITPTDYIGQEIGVFKISGIAPEKNKYGQVQYEAICKHCGWKKIDTIAKLKDDAGTKCIHVNVNGHYINTKTKWKNKRIRSIFRGMKQRCYNENDNAYQWYGAKGVTICDEWLDNPELFESWSEQNGYQDGYTIDRINSDKGYQPDNCRWVSLEDNARYKSTTHRIEVNGEVHSGKEWSKILGFGPNVINKYIKHYGMENVVDFIADFLKEPYTIPKQSNTSYYEVYLNAYKRPGSWALYKSKYMYDHIPEIISMFDLDYREQFGIEYLPNCICYFSGNDFVVENREEGQIHVHDEYADNTLRALLNGSYIIKYRVYKPIMRKKFFFVNNDGKVSYRRWNGKFDNVNLYMIGNCYSSEARAINTRMKWQNFYNNIHIAS